MKKNGFTIVEVITSVAILAISTLAVGAFTSASSQTQQKTNFKLSVTQVKSNILSLISNEAVWRKHIQLANTTDPTTEHILNPELLCLKQGTPCVEGVYNLTILDQSGKIVIDPNNPTQGFTRDGAVCNSFSATDTNPACPWRLDVTWSPSCRPAADGPCLRPQISIQIQVQASAQFLSSNMMTTTTTVNQLIDQQKYGPPVARNVISATNSTHYGWGSTVAIDPAPFIFTESPGTLTVAAPPSGTSQQGGTVTLSGNQFVYTAPTGFYGSDFFNYTVTDSYTGLSSNGIAIVKVMTPWTWTGAANDGDFSNKKNFCGKVVAGVCDGTTLQPSYYVQGDYHVIFNENCTNCDVTISSPQSVMTMELGTYYRGKVNQKADVNVAMNITNTWNKTPYFKMSGGTWVGDNSSTLSVTPTNYFNPINEGFYLGGGDFYAPAVLSVQSDILISNSNAFHHQNHVVNWTGGYPYGTTFVGDGLTQFYDFNFGIPNVSSTMSFYHRQNVKNSFTILHNASISPRAGDSEASPNTSNSGTQVTLLGDLYLNNLNSGGCVPSGSVLTPVPIIFASGGDQHIYGQNTALVDGIYNSYTCAPLMVIQKPAGKMYFHDFIATRGGLILNSADSYDFTGSTLSFAGGSAAKMILNTKGQAINSLAYDSQGQPQLFEVQNDLTINGDFKYRAFWTSSGRPFMVSNVLRSTQTRYLNVKGNVYLSGASDAGSGNLQYSPVVRMNGTGDQNLVGNQGTTKASDFLIEIDKPSGNLNMSGSVGVFQQFKITKANMNYAPGTSLYTQWGGSGYIDIWLDGSTIPNLVFNNNTAYHTDLNVDNFTLSNTQRLKADAGKKINIYKDLNYLGWAEDSSTIDLVLKGTGYTQNVNFVKPSGPWVDPFMYKFESFYIQGANSVNFSGSGKIQQMQISNATTVNMTSSTKITAVSGINVACGSTLNQNGATISGTVTACP